jgi:hypothetical protein
MPAPGDAAADEPVAWPEEVDDREHSALVSQQNTVLEAILVAAEKGLAEAEPGGPAQHRLHQLVETGREQPR